jgi:mono/diheme cytochrome c family protein
MSLFAGRAPQIWTLEPRILESQFHARKPSAIFALCRCARLGRNDVALWLNRFRVIVPPGSDKVVQKGLRSMRAILALVLLCTAFSGKGQAEPSADAIARGKALAEAADCAGCHTADRSKPFAGGKRIDTLFGAIYSPNLTPDRDTGLGAWSDDEFYRALRYGMGRDGSRYYPAFPYPNFTKMTRDDLLAIRAYLATLAPVPNRVAPPELLWPLNYRIVMRAWNLLFFQPGIFEPNQQKSTEWNRGGYLVTGAAHCGVCHTPKNLFGADRRGRAFGGGLVQGWFAPRLDGAERSGLKSWSVGDIVEYLQSGRNGRSHAGGPMAEVVANSTSKMSDADVRAIALYLKDLPTGKPDPVVVDPPPQRGPTDLSAATRQRQSAVGRPLQHAAHHPRRCADRDDAAGTQSRIDARLRQAVVGSGDCGCHQLHAEFMGQCRAAGEAGAGEEGADATSGVNQLIRGAPNGSAQNRGPMTGFDVNPAS